MQHDRAGRGEDRGGAAVLRAGLRWAGIALAAVAVVAGARALASRFRTTASAPPPAAAARPVPVVVAAARQGDIRVYLDGLGTVTPLATVTVRCRVDGQLVAVHFRKARWSRGRPPRRDRPAAVPGAARRQAEGQLARDQALLANAKVDLHATAAAGEGRDPEAAARHAGGAGAPVRRPRSQTDRGQIDAAKLQLTYCSIIAPIGGRLGLRLVDPGNIVHATDAGGLVAITQISPIDVVFTMPEDNLPRLRDAWPRASRPS